MKIKLAQKKLWIILSCLIISLLSLWLVFAQSNPVSAANSAEIEDVENLNRINVRFGGTQNSLIVNLKHSNGEDSNLFFTLDEINDCAPFIACDNENNSQAEFVYIANRNNNSEKKYTLSSSSEIDIQSDCQTRSNKIIITRIRPQRPENVGNDKWKNHSLDNGQYKELKINLWLSLNSQAPSCFLLETTSALPSTDNKYLFNISGEKTADNSCQGLVINGRGGDDLEKPKTTWHCLEDLSKREYAKGIRPSWDNWGEDLIHWEGQGKDWNIGTNYVVFTEVRPDGQKCGGRILVSKNEINTVSAKSSKNINLTWQDWHDDCSKGPFQSKSFNTQAFNVLQANEEDSKGELQGDNRNTENINTLEPVDSCESRASDIGWIICGPLKAMDSIISGIENTLYSHLRLERSQYHGEEGSIGNDGYKKVWQNMRNLATFAIVGTALFMVISTALDVGVFSNYTVKKYLPKLVIGTILIQISWGLGDLMIQAIQQIGDVLAALLYSAFGEGVEDWGLDNIFASDQKAGTVGIFTTVVATGAAWYTGWLAIVPLAITTLSAFVIGFVALVIRKYILILLLILAPLGLALWILPGSDRVWKTYIRMFIYLLLLYPAVLISIAAGKIFSSLIMQESGSFGSNIDSLISLLVYIMGFAAIPLIMKWAAGALGGFAGMANDKTKGLIDRPRNALKERHKRIMEGKRSRRREKITEGFREDAIIGKENMSKRQRWAHRKRAAGMGWESIKSGESGGVMRQVVTKKGRDEAKRKIEKTMENPAITDPQREEKIKTVQQGLSFNEQDMREIIRNPKTGSIDKEAAFRQLITKNKDPVGSILKLLESTKDADETNATLKLLKHVTRNNDDSYKALDEKAPWLVGGGMELEEANQVTKKGDDIVVSLGQPALNNLRDNSKPKNRQSWDLKTWQLYMGGSTDETRSDLSESEKELFKKNVELFKKMHMPSELGKMAPNPHSLNDGDLNKLLKYIETTKNNNGIRLQSDIETEGQAERDRQGY